MTYATDRLYAEIAYVAYYLHWSREEILDLEHARTSAVRGADRRPEHPDPAELTDSRA